MPTSPADSLSCQAILGAIDCGVVVHGPDGAILASNNKARSLLGLTADQLHARTSFDPAWHTLRADGSVFPPEDHPVIVSLRTGARIEGVVMGVVRPGGPGGSDSGAPQDLVWLNVTSDPLHTEAGAVRQVIVTFSDVTAQRAAEAARRSEHDLLKQITATALMGIVVLGDDGTVRLANARAQELLGGSVRLETGAPTAPDPLGRILPVAAVRAQAGRGPVWSHRTTALGADDRRRQLSINGTRLQATDDTPGSCVFSIHDITASEAAQRARAVSEQRLSLAVWAADMALVEWTVEGELSIDQAWLRRRGWGSAPVPDTIQGWRRALAPEDVARINASRDLHFAGKAPSIDVEFELPTPRHVVARLVARVVAHHPDGRPRRVAGMLADVTAEHEARERQRANQTQMVESAAFQATARVTGGVANDFNNLLVGMLGAVDQARERLPADHRIATELSLIEESASRAARLTRELLAISGHGRFRLGPVDLGALVQDLVPLANAAAKSRARLRIKVLPDLPYVEADPGQLRQMLLHLINNAVEAVDPAKGVVQLRVKPRTLGPEDGQWVGQPPREPTDFVCLSVRDNGRGVLPEQRAVIFQPFTTFRDGHRGLGLAAVLGMVRGHGGHLSFESDVSKGTTVTVALPTVPAPAPAPQPADPSEAPPVAGARVLVVDDEPVVLRIAAHQLTEAGFAVTTATDGAEGLALWRTAGPFDVVVSDLSMPVLDGEGLVRALRADDPDQAILVISGYSRSEVVGRMVGAGDVEFLAKPFAPRKLVHWVRALAAQARERAAAARAPGDPAR